MIQPARQSFMLAISAALLLSTTCATRAATLPAGLTEQNITTTVEHARLAFDVPGIAVAVVQDGEVVFSRGYGRRAQDSASAPVDTRTMFAIGSNTKEFTATALAQLVDQGKLKWNDRIIDHMPEFRVADPSITRDFRVSDLLTHHSGMGLGAGDLMLFSHSTFTRPEVLAGLPFMPFTASFRSEYAYNNLLYVVAGALVERMTGQSWEEVVQKHLIDAASLPACQSTPPVKGQTNVATGEGESTVLPERSALRLPAVAPAGGIWCSADGVARWAQTYLNGGRAPNGQQIFSQTSRDALWAPHGLLPLPDTADATKTHFRAYGYGWFMEDFFGLKRVWHTGTIGGMVSYVTFLPERKSGIVVLTNHDDPGATYAIATTLSSYVATGKSADWVTHFQNEKTAKQAANAKRAAETGPGSPARPFITLSHDAQQDYVGTYRDDWRGPITISRRGADLRMSFSHADGLTGTLSALPHDLFIVRWDDRGQDADDDSYVQFERDVSGQISGMKMQVIGSDFSFDAQDLHPKKVSSTPEAPNP
ncbi:serine hydrolase [Gluconobacter roseus]|uniref:Serine hydrolase n=1 Tax=Gluconobacter roseus NBRC 3990 TaxID=1307950 RepID=A0A4Y3M3D0_9PROT|nr:serine hydrolase [Gluconobacter roseus]KXV44251.1 beta-lactamase [Gluconobacter roseus]GBR44391.1 beta-lactamase [Gluconobacter roseus NBRC 3990]GEB02606.1 serine hydrolase [Gluconobacter roseus NBRC 3990]GLP93066.1 serine hydrolase [Gluconobacter roseus NBRC 3990]